MKQKYKNLSTSCDTSLVLMSCFFIIMGIPATIKFFSSLRSSLQLLVIKNRIKATTKKPKGIKLKLTQNAYTRTLKQVYKGISIQK